MAIARRGVHLQLEAEANRLLRESLEGVTKHSEKADLLTPWKERERRRREVYTTSGTPDASIRRGIFHRALNPSRPHLNSRDGIAPPIRDAEAVMKQFDGWTNLKQA